MSEWNASEREALEEEKLASVSQLLFRCARLLNERAIANMREITGKPLRAAHTSLFPHIDLKGTRATTLAERLGVSKQAISPLIDELESWGFLERIRDPSDGRAKLVRFSTAPGFTLLDGVRGLRAVDAQMQEVLGEGQMEAFHDALLRLNAWLDDAEDVTTRR